MKKTKKKKGEEQNEKKEKKERKGHIIVLFERHSDQAVKRWSSCVPNGILIITQKVIAI